MNLLPVHECFYTWQGEGTHLGRAAYFIRLMGCPIQCPWCDSAGTWHPDFVPAKKDKRSPDALAEAAAQTAAEFVVITGGEPTIHNLTELTDCLHQKNLPVHLETSGAFPIQGSIDWITLSPKRWKMPLTENLEKANDFKLIVEDARSIEMWMEHLEGFTKGKTIWLHPEWSQRKNPEVLNSISNTVKQCGAPFRAGWQLHKCYNVDALDAGSQKAVPLGGRVGAGV